jgi:hypothetical protein
MQAGVCLPNRNAAKHGPGGIGVGVFSNQLGIIKSGSCVRREMRVKRGKGNDE